MPISPLVIVPTYNEADNIVPLLDAILALPQTFHVLVVDDTSPDGTAERVRERARRPDSAERINLLLRPLKQGLGVAYVDAFRWALARGYTMICQMDADFSHSPSDLPRLLAATAEGDLVLGSRYMAGGRTEGWPFRRWLLSRCANLLAQAALRTSLHDLTGGFKAYRAEALAGIDFTRIESGGYSFQIETTQLVLASGRRVAEIPIVFRERIAGKSKIASTKVTFETLLLLFRLFARR